MKITYDNILQALSYTFSTQNGQAISPAGMARNGSFFASYIAFQLFNTSAPSICELYFTIGSTKVGYVYYRKSFSIAWGQKLSLIDIKLALQNAKKHKTYIFE